jgi:hypothetical protein
MTVYATSGGNISTRQVTGSIRGRYEAKLSLSATTADGRVSGSYTYSVKVSNTIRTPDGASYAVDSSTLSSRGSLSGVRQADGSYILSFDGSGQEVWRSATLTSQQRTTTLNSLGQYRATIQ